MGGASVLRIVCIAFALLSLVASGARHHPRSIPHARNPSKLFMDYESSHEHLLVGAGCEVPLPPEIHAPKKNVWAHLSRTESEQIMKWVMGQKELNLTSQKNEVEDVQLMTPNKTNVCPIVRGSKNSKLGITVEICLGSILTFSLLL